MTGARFVFVAGLHRSGTSLLARLIARHPDVSGIADAPVPENEGCYLQGAIPHTALDGRPGHFATDPAQHMDEGSAYNRLEIRNRMLADWSPWFDPAKPWWLEKSPVNLIRTRLYQQLFPLAQFVIILRHPQVMAAALGKWVDDPPERLTRYGLDAYEILRGDLPYLHSALVLRYEDLVRQPEQYRRALFAFLQLPDAPANDRLRDGNTDYAIEPAVDGASARQLTDWGYLPGGATTTFTPVCRHPLGSVRKAVLEALD
ncbi:sulfotransferase family protein [Qipengyuania sp.]|uniref:sulfotransferase family protein n=1 Tax=Qipengyuania sp. TaxID=2004515 RepID=UPI0037362796